MLNESLRSQKPDWIPRRGSGINCQSTTSRQQERFSENKQESFLSHLLPATFALPAISQETPASMGKCTLMNPHSGAFTVAFLNKIDT